LRCWPTIISAARERIENPLPASYYDAFERVDRDPLFRLVVAGQGDRVVARSSSACCRA
jgi:hypothetical protein